jgi:tetratricopeptide (TPR) repeat protein
METEAESGLSGFLGLRKARLEQEEGYLLDYFEGQLSQQSGDYEKATASFEDSVRKKPEFVFGYISLAVIQYLKQDFDHAIEILKRAQQQDPNSAYVLNDLGACYLIKGDFAQAKTQLENVNRISPSFVSIANLAEAHRYLGEARTAIGQDQVALQLLNTENENERVIGGQIVSSFMPEKAGDKPPAFYQTISGMDGKRTMVHYALSLDYALLGDFDKADEAFEEGAKLDSKQSFNQYVGNRILSIEYFSGLNLQPATLNWLEEKRKRLAT